jgi:diguanylate cyclase (GGDEF)-like protein
MSNPYRLLCLSAHPPDLVTSAFGPFVVQACASLDELARELAAQASDVLLLGLKEAGGIERLLAWTGLSRTVQEMAVVALAPAPTLNTSLRLLQVGIRDVLAERELGDEGLGRVLRIAIERKKLDDAARRAYSIDLTTGLPNHHQLLEHMTHLLALREREPAAMALIALHLEGFSAAEAQLGPEAANVLRRKVAVRLRASLRASDVVSALGGDTFAVLLSWMDAGEDGERVAQKLLSSVSQPFQVAGRHIPMGVRIGVGQYPAHGKDARSLLARAVSRASGEGMSRLLALSPAANDEAPPTSG